MTKLLCPYCHIAIATNIRTPHIKNIDKQYNYLIQSQERQTSGQYSCSLDDSSPLWTINSCTIQLPILLDLPQTYSPSKVGLQHSQNGAESKIIIHSNTHYHNLLSSGEVTPMLAVQGCCNNHPVCGTALCSLHDMHFKMLTFYNSYQ